MSNSNNMSDLFEIVKGNQSNGADRQPASSNGYKQPASNYGYASENNGRNNHHIGYVRTLKTILYLQVFVIPLLFIVPIYVFLAEELDSGFGVFLLALIAYGIIAFILWIALSYFVYLFDNIAHIAIALDDKAQK